MKNRIRLLPATISISIGIQVQYKAVVSAVHARQKTKNKYNGYSNLKPSSETDPGYR